MKIQKFRLIRKQDVKFKPLYVNASIDLERI